MDPGTQTVRGLLLRGAERVLSQKFCFVLLHNSQLSDNLGTPKMSTGDKAHRK